MATVPGAGFRLGTTFGTVGARTAAEPLAAEKHLRRLGAEVAILILQINCSSCTVNPERVVLHSNSTLAASLLRLLL
jgi:hypothetical protein